MTHPKREPLSRIWFLSRSFKQVPQELIGGKILYAHPDGYFVNAYGQKVKHDYCPAMKRGDGGSKYPKMRSYGNKLCHHLMYETFYGPRTEGLVIDHINGDKLDYSAANLELVSPDENNRRAKYLRIIREYLPHHTLAHTRADYLRWFAMPFDDFKAMFYQFTKS